METLYPQGDTAASLLYGLSRAREQQTEFLAILASHSFSQFNSQDAYGWTVLHRAAAWGTADDVNTLLDLGTVQSFRSRKLRWTPLICAVAHKNINTLHALCDRTADRDVCEEQDIRRWNLLHIAVGYGNLEAIPYLLKKGVDPDAKSTCTSSHVPLMVRERSVTPGEMARVFGETTYREWINALDAEGCTNIGRAEQIDWVMEGTNETFGECKCCDSWAA